MVAPPVNLLAAELVACLCQSPVFHQNKVDCLKLVFAMLGLLNLYASNL